MSYIQSKVGSLDNANHVPKGGDVKIPTQKVDFKSGATSKVGSTDYLDRVPQGGN